MNEAITRRDVCRLGLKALAVAALGTSGLGAKSAAAVAGPILRGRYDYGKGATKLTGTAFTRRGLVTLTIYVSGGYVDQFVIRTSRSGTFQIFVNTGCGTVDAYAYDHQLGLEAHKVIRPSNCWT